MKITVLFALAILLSSCGKFEQIKAHYEGWAQVCVNGVSYLQFVSGVTVEYTPDGKIKTCKS